MAAVEVPGLPGVIFYTAPSTSEKMVAMKRPSYQKGDYPAHLQRYAGQAAGAGRACKGRRGPAFRICMTEQTANLVNHNPPQRKKVRKYRRIVGSGGAAFRAGAPEPLGR